jgi:CRP/FNR family cyclic AMP-dependent transcriptional regulator
MRERRKCCCAGTNVSLGLKRLHVIFIYVKLITLMNNMVNFLKQSDIFYQFTPTQLEMVANLCQEVVFNAGDLIFQENSSNKELYVIAQGEVDILINRGMGNTEKKEAAVARLRRGQSFGEVALVDEGLRSASARASQKDTRLLIIQREKLIILCETYPQLGYRLMYNLAADLAMKIRNTDLRIREQLLYKPTDKK